MNMLKFGYGIVLDGLPNIPEFLFFSRVWMTPDPILFKCCIHIECLEKNICLEAKHVGAHLMDQLKKKCVI